MSRPESSRGVAWAIGVLSVLACIGLLALGDRATIGERDSAQRVAREPASPVKAASQQGAHDVAALDDKPTPLAAAGPRGGPTPSLPEASTALAEQLPILVALANEGDPVATCRLAVGTNRCSRYFGLKLRFDRSVESLDRVAASGNPALFVESLAKDQIAIEDYSRFCETVDPAQLPEMEYLLQKALGAMTPRQKTLLAMMRPDGELRRLRPRRMNSQQWDYVVPQFIADHAADFLKSGYAARDPLAIEGLILMHAPKPLIGGLDFVPRLPSQREYFIYASLYRRLFGPDALDAVSIGVLEAVARSMPRETVEKLKAEVELEAQRWAQAQGMAGLDTGHVLPKVAEVVDAVAACER